MIVEVEKLAHNQEGMTAATRAGLILQEQGFLRYPPVQWHQPALLAIQDGRCVGGVNYTIDNDDLIVFVDLAWSDHPSVLAPLLIRLRAKFRGTRYTRIDFAAHSGNERMQKLVSAMGLRPFSSRFRVPLQPAASD